MRFSATMIIRTTASKTTAFAAASGNCRYEVCTWMILPMDAICWPPITPMVTKSPIIIGSIFVITIVMGDFVTIGVMGGQQIASVGKIIQVQTSYLQFPMAAANAVILLAVTLMMIWGLTRVADIRKEL